jgi:YidC/Oxa1 family membrane protein insertase
MLNVLALLYTFLGYNFGISIIAFTILVRLVTLPLTLRQMRSSVAMSSLQPKMKELQEKYGKSNPDKYQKEVMQLYKEHGVNPAGCLIPTLIQFPIWIGLYQAIIQTIGEKPEQLLTLSHNLYQNVPIFAEAARQIVPLNSSFLWLNLAHPDPYYILPVLVAGSTYLQQKFMSTPSADPQQASMTQSMTMMMPLMFGFMTLQFSSGLAIYWIISNIIGVVMQLTITGKWGELASDLSSLKLPFGSGGTPPPSDTVAQIAEGEEAEEGKKEPKDAKRRKRSRGRRKKR